MARSELTLSTTFRFTINESEITVFERESKREALQRSAKIVRTVARAKAPGEKLPQSIRYRTTETTATIYSNLPEAEWVEYGTGFYGPNGTPIVPEHGKFLKFTAGGVTVYTTFSRGQRPQPFLRPALEALNGREL